ncbi:golgin subfamily A member 6-like protein 7 isoform X1 [Oscarella lobularis]|uniref:golgin subfamily A member 6-like protein 7 isoform X1 n=1 Tax=Oscarella lobularis TaxID=121494 RepID=UPI003313D1BB
MKFAKGTWAGIELESPEGKNDGSVQGHRYFDCKPNFGIFVLAKKVMKAKSLTSKETKEKDDEIEKHGILLKEKDDETERMVEKMRRMKKELQEKDEEVRRMDQKMKRMKEDLKEKDDETEKMDEKMRRLKKNVQEKDEETERMDDKMRRMKKDLQEKDDEIERIYEEMKRMKKDLKEKDDETKRMDGEIKRIKKDLQEKDRKLAMKEEEVRRMEEEVRRMEEEMEGMREDMGRDEAGEVSVAETGIGVQGAVGGGDAGVGEEEEETGIGVQGAVGGRDAGAGEEEEEGKYCLRPRRRRAVAPSAVSPAAKQSESEAKRILNLPIGDFWKEAREGLKREGARITTRDGIPRRTLAYFERAIDTKWENRETCKTTTALLGMSAGKEGFYHIKNRLVKAWQSVLTKYIEI